MITRAANVEPDVLHLLTSADLARLYPPTLSDPLAAIWPLTDAAADSAAVDAVEGSLTGQRDRANQGAYQRASSPSAVRCSHAPFGVVPSQHYADYALGHAGDQPRN